MENVKKAVIPAAGLGTRFLPATKAQPKEMLPIIDKPVIHFVVEEVMASGIDDIIIITGRGKRAIEDYFDKNIELEQNLEETGKHDLLKELKELSDLVDVHYVRQKEPKGLGHAISCAEKHVGGEPFAVLLGDTIIESKVPCTKQLIDVSKKYGKSSVAVERVAKDKISRYGIIGGNPISKGIYEVNQLVEKPKPSEAPSDMGMVGRYVLSQDIFDYLKGGKPGVGGEIQLTDALSGLVKDRGVYGLEFEGQRYDAGDKGDYLKAIIEFALKRDDLRSDLQKFLKNLR